MKQNVCIVCGGELTYDCGEWHCLECGAINDIVDLYTDSKPCKPKKKREKESSRKSKKSSPDS